MKKLNPEKLSVEYRDNVTYFQPVLGRKMTLTHSDNTGQLFLTVGLSYAFDKVTKLRDEVLAEWKEDNGKLYLYVYVSVDGKSGPEMAATRNEVFRRELPLALQAIVYGDKGLYQNYPSLEYAPIWIHFDSSLPQLNTFEYWGTPLDYQA
ncbi:hypothetical protein FZW96_16360 [Bacillus sp. BGMRC 2118]|nr:hypothetical protein FZW96_16360 [Bacillus sp. BGMRC 2118]